MVSLEILSDSHDEKFGNFFDGVQIFRFNRRLRTTNFPSLVPLFQNSTYHSRQVWLNSESLFREFVARHDHCVQRDFWRIDGFLLVLELRESSWERERETSDSHLLFHCAKSFCRLCRNLGLSLLYIISVLGTVFVYVQRETRVTIVIRRDSQTIWFTN